MLSNLSSPPQVNGAALTGLDLALKRVCPNPAGFLMDCAIDPQQLGQASYHIALQHYVQLYEQLQNQFNNHHFGAQIGALTRPKKAGILGFLALNAPSLAVAINDCARYLPIMLQGFELKHKNPSAPLSQIHFELSHAANAQINEQGLAWVCNIIRGVLNNRRWQPVNVFFAPGRPAHHPLLCSIFNSPIGYWQGHTGLTINKQDLQRSHPHADSWLYRTLQQQCEILLSRVNSIALPLQQLQSSVRKAILQGDCNLQSIARRHQTTARRLQSHLKKQNQNFAHIVNQSRHQLAVELLSDNNSIAQTAAILGYSESASFSRAFKLWQGVSPKQYQQQTPPVI